MKLYGKNVVSEAIKSGATIDKLMVEKNTNSPIIAQAREAGIKVQFVDKFLLDKESLGARHQGFIAFTTEFNYSDVDEILQVSDKNKFIVILDGIEDPHNLGSILRVCECANVDGVIIAKNRAVCVNETVIRVSSGAAEHIKVARVVNINQTIEILKKLNIWVFGAEVGGDSIYHTDLQGDIALVIGSEGKGISRLTRELCDKMVSIPQLGQVNSLNASVACGIAVFEAVRQRSKK